MAATRRRKTRAQPNLTAERVRDEALRLIEADGLDEFSTRKLGRALGVEAMAIYWYYPSKEALLDAVVETLVAKLGGAPSPPPSRVSSGTAVEEGDFMDALRQLAHAYRALAHAYPNAFQLLATRRFATEGTYRFLEGLFSLAEQYGLDAWTTARYYRLVSSYCSGVALNELAGLREIETRRDAEASRAPFPHLTQVFDYLAPDYYGDVFSFGLELLLTALRQESTRRSSPPKLPLPASSGKVPTKTKQQKKTRSPRSGRKARP